MTKNQDITSKAAPLLSHVQQEIQRIFQDRVVSIFKLGSLGSHGDFSLCSDVDIAIMLDEILESDQNTINTLWEQLKKSEHEYANRLSVFWSSYNANDFANGRGRFPPLDRLDLIQHAILIVGTDRRSELSEPNHRDLVLESANFISTFMLAGDKLQELTHKQHLILEKGARYFTKFVLFPVRLIFTLDCPGVIGSNKDAVDHFNQHWKKSMPSEVSEVVNFAYDLRNTDPNEPVTFNVSTLKTALLPLYTYCLERYHKAASDLGNGDIAATIAEYMLY